MKNRKSRWTKDDTELTFLCFPTLVWYFLFSYLPMFGIVIAFKNYRVSPGHGFIYSLFHSKTVWFDNFKFFITSPDFPILLRNTFLYNSAFIVLGIIIPVALAIILTNIHSGFKSKCYQTLMFFPHFMSWVVVSYFVYAFLSPDKGFLNMVLAASGKQTINWYADARYWPVILIFMNLWKTTGYTMVVYLAAITGVDGTMYEAAVIDGATKWQQTKRITIPSILPIIIMMFLLNVGKIFYSDFGLFYQITQRVPQPLYGVASTFDTYIYNAIQSGIPLGLNAAATFFQSIACCITVMLANAVVKRIDPDSAII
ncbi:ABC transporter permease [Treponema brennaborense]|uniref:ABC-type transporter, integral membrane subunit n=1 Tax=Treponema brennaborense (strain DSM 12168 / CIP 105900 / DD5/3) TaxID=906968 RepID=F4LP35_TREBD|nr:ABC transporter permease subunit [Treponema brennaborense]AEE15911.1 ABC-type transporter, integral membrane subunit [Treponema brennaborense DSM 12168]